MDAIERLNLFNRLYTISEIVAAVGFVFALFLFFHFDIRTLFALSTGRARAKTLERMRQREESGGSMRERASSSRELRESGARAVESGGLSHTDAVTQENAPGAQETTLLPQERETTLLSGQKLETTVLSHGGEGAAYAGMTAPLPSIHPDFNLSGVNFKVTEEIMFLNTDEII